MPEKKQPRASDFEILDLGFRSRGLTFEFEVEGSGLRVHGFGFRVSGAEFRVSGWGFRVEG